MKWCNFRPLCWLALIVMVVVASCLVSLWLTLLLVIGGGLILFSSKLPARFKAAVLIVTAMTVVSYVVTTLVVPNPYQHDYQPDSGLRGIVLRYVRWYLGCFLDEDHVSLLLAMMFGDKSDLAWGIRHNFSVTGITHLLAVSGLHVALLAGVVLWLLKLCRVPARIRVFILAVVLMFYTYLCGWQYAIIRAVIMCLVFAVARHHLRVADSLSVLSLAAVIILVLFPYALTTVSFWLSFSCMLGINCFYQRIFRILPSKAVAMYLSCTIASLPFQIYYFGGIPVLGLVANVILVPLLVAAFYLGMFAVTTVVMGAVLWLAGPLLNFVTWVTAAIGQLSWATFNVSCPVWSIGVYLLAMLFASRYLFWPPKVKYPVVVALFACYFSCLVF